MELEEPSKLYCRISEKPGFMTFLNEIGKLQDNLMMKYSRFDGSPESISDIYRNKNGEWSSYEPIVPEKTLTQESGKLINKLKSEGIEQRIKSVHDVFDTPVYQDVYDSVRGEIWEASSELAESLWTQINGHSLENQDFESDSGYNDLRWNLFDTLINELGFDIA